MKLPISKCFFDEADFKAVTKPLKSGWVMQGPFVQEFETSFARLAKVKYAAAVSNGTAALILALKAMGIKPGDEVIVPSFTFVATANAVEIAGGVPHFCDIDCETFNIDPDSLELCVNHKTKAVIAVSQFGLHANFDKIEKICKKHNVPLLEDAACSLGASSNGIHSGNFGVGATFSFHPRKSITTGEGGMVATNDKKIYNLVKTLRNHGLSKALPNKIPVRGSLLSDMHACGFNFRMTDIQAALGLSQLKKLDKILEHKITVAKRYNLLFEELPQIVAPKVPQNFRHTYQSYVVMFDSGEKRNEIVKKLNKAGIGANQGAHAVHTLSYYKKKYDIDDNLCKNALKARNLSMALPMYYGFNEKNADKVVNSIKNYLLK